MIYIAYIVVAAIVVMLSVKASEYVDMLEKITSLSGAFIGGILLSSVTSLPELFTSISATVFLDKPQLCMGNILGSNLFNLTVLSILFLYSFQTFCKTRISVSHSKVAVCVALMYLVIFLNMMKILNFEVLTVSITSLLVIFIYVGGIKAMSEENGDGAGQEQTAAAELSLHQILIRFFFTSVGIIVFSVVITYITDEIALRLNLGAGLAGAIFLGIATSLPEVSSTYTLIRMKNFDIAVGNIIGSNLFNVIILSVADFLYVGNGIYDFTDGQTRNLLVFGLIATAVMLGILRSRGKAVKMVGCFAILLCYGAFLIG